MTITFKANREVKQAYALPPVGNFALEVEPPKTPSWDHCREQFASKFDGRQAGFYYSIRPGTAMDVASFLVKCEGVIGICDMKTPYLHSCFSRTNKDVILWVEPSAFWLDCSMKRSVLTAFLRCGLNYDREQDNFDEAMFSDRFAENRWVRETRAATMRFLFGFTRWSGPVKDSTAYMSQKHGWHEEFRSLDNLGVRKKLALPDGEVKETSIIGVESLWA